MIETMKQRDDETGIGFFRRKCSAAEDLEIAEMLLKQHRFDSGLGEYEVICGYDMKPYSISELNILYEEAAERLINNKNIRTREMTMKDLMKKLLYKLFGKKVVVYYTIDKSNPNAKPLYKKHEDDSCWDVFAASCEHVYGRKTEVGNMVPDYYEYGTGLRFAIPKGYEIECRPRSSIYKTGLVLTNSCGTVDCGYDGEVKAKFYSVKNGTPYEVGDRIMQIRLNPARYDEVDFVLVDELPEQIGSRGKCGFGSTGRK